MKPDNHMEVATVTAIFDGEQVNFVATAHPAKGPIQDFAEASATIMCLVLEAGDRLAGAGVKPTEYYSGVKTLLQECIVILGEKSKQVPK